MFPDLQGCVLKKQAEQATSHNNSKPLRSFKVGDPVYNKDFSSTSILWIPGTVVKVTGPLSYHIKLTDNRVACRHVDAVRVHHESSDPLPLNDSPLTQEDLYFPSRTRTPIQSVQPQPPPVYRHLTRSHSRPNYYRQRFFNTTSDLRGGKCRRLLLCMAIVYVFIGVYY